MARTLPGVAALSLSSCVPQVVSTVRVGVTLMAVKPITKLVKAFAYVSAMQWPSSFPTHHTTLPQLWLSSSCSVSTMVIVTCGGRSQGLFFTVSLCSSSLRPKGHSSCLNHLCIAIDTRCPWCLAHTTH